MQPTTNNQTVNLKNRQIMFIIILQNKNLARPHYSEILKILESISFILERILNGL